MLSLPLTDDEIIARFNDRSQIEQEHDWAIVAADMISEELPRDRFCSNFDYINTITHVYNTVRGYIRSTYI